jgi:hypothetical protein
MAGVMGNSILCSMSSGGGGSGGRKSGGYRSGMIQRELMKSDFADIVNSARGGSRCKWRFCRICAAG